MTAPPDPSAQRYYAHAMPARDGGVWYANASPDRRWLGLFGFKEPIVPVRLREASAAEPPCYWGWLEASSDHYEYVWLSRLQMDSCFPYGAAAEERRGRGRVVALVIEPVPEESVP